MQSTFKISTLPHSTSPVLILYCNLRAHMKYMQHARVHDQHPLVCIIGIILKLSNSAVTNFCRYLLPSLRQGHQKQFHSGQATLKKQETEIIRIQQFL